MFGNTRNSGSRNTAGLNAAAEPQYRYRKAYMGDPISDNASEEEVRSAEREQWVDVSRTLFHYTNLAGFMGIIESGGLWASDNRFLNDSEEVTHGIEYATDILRKNIETSSLPEFALIMAEAVGMLQERLGVGQLVACYSLAEDSLEQWRGYGRGDGICIKFDTKSEGHLPLFKQPMLVRRRVFYSEKDKGAFILSKMIRFLDALAKDIQEFGKVPSAVITDYAKYMALSMSNAVASFKNDAFANEQEVRMIVSLQQAEGFVNGVKFRTSPYGPIAYVNTRDCPIATGLAAVLISGDVRTEGSGLLPIASVRVGPSPHQSLVAESVRTFLRIKGYTETEVEVSRVPYRGA
jgi:hypothetical protein